MANTASERRSGEQASFLHFVSSGGDDLVRYNFQQRKH